MRFTSSYIRETYTLTTQSRCDTQSSLKSHSHDHTRGIRALRFYWGLRLLSLPITAHGSKRGEVGALVRTEAAVVPEDAPAPDTIPIPMTDPVVIVQINLRGARL